MQSMIVLALLLFGSDALVVRVAPPRALSRTLRARAHMSVAVHTSALPEADPATDAIAAFSHVDDFAAIPETRAAAKVRYANSDWLPNLKTLLSSQILRRIKGHLLATTAVAIGVAALRLSGVLKGAPPPATIHSLLGGCLSLLLVFRTNSSYERWWEARKAWGAVLAHSREGARACDLFIPSTSPQRLRLAAALCAFPELMRLHLVNRPRLEHTPAARSACVNSGMTPQDSARVVGANNRALECTRVMYSAVRAAFMEEEEGKGVKNGKSAEEPRPAEEERRRTGGGSSHSSLGLGLSLSSSISASISGSVHRSMQRAVERKLLEQEVGALAMQLGACERILNAPVPFSYSRHTSRFLSLWLATLPFVLPVHPLALPPAIAAVAWALLAIEEIGHVIEEPFNMPFETDQPDHPRTSLNMEDIADAVVRDVVSAVPELVARPCDRGGEEGGSDGELGGVLAALGGDVEGGCDEGGRCHEGGGGEEVRRHEGHGDDEGQAAASSSLRETLRFRRRRHFRALSEEGVLIN